MKKESPFFSIPGMEDSPVQLPSLVRPIRSAYLQDISAPFGLIVERFDPERSGGEFLFFSEEGAEKIVLTKKQYQLMLDRPLHSHEYLELMLVLSGSIRNFVEDEFFDYSAGQGCLMNTHIHHKEVPVNQSEVLFVELRREFLTRLCDEMRREGSSFSGTILPSFLRDSLMEETAVSSSRQYLEFSPFEDDRRIVRSRELLCCTSLEAMRKKRPGYGFLIRSAILGFLNDLSDSTLYTLQSTASSVSHSDYLVSRIDLLIRSSHGRIRRKELEQHLAYNGDYLNQIYKKKKGQSIASACQDATVQDAKQLLKHSEKSIDEIMQILGVTSRGSFFELFRRQTGMTPREYRVSRHKDQEISER